MNGKIITVYTNYLSLTFPYSWQKNQLTRPRRMRIKLLNNSWIVQHKLDKE